MTARPLDLDHLYDVAPRLIVWNPENPDSSYVLEDVDARTIKAAVFTPGEAKGLFIVNQAGLIYFDLTTENSILLRSDFNASTINSAIFSPNSAWLMIQIQQHLRFVSMDKLFSDSESAKTWLPLTDS